MNILLMMTRAIATLSNSSTARLDVEVLLTHVLKVDRAYLRTYPEKKLTTAQQNVFTKLLKRRAHGEPIAYIVGHQEFWSLDFLVNEFVLIPRPETELLVETALDKIKKENAKVLELGTGSGAVSLALGSEKPQWHIIATDFSKEALMVAKENTKRLNIKNVNFVLSDWFNEIPQQQFDAIISNPPYVAENDPHLEKGDVRFEPRVALVSGQEGLEAIRLIVYQAKNYLKPGGCLMVEHGYDQARAVREILEHHHYAYIALQYDLAGHPRVTVATYSVTAPKALSKNNLYI